MTEIDTNELPDGLPQLNHPFDEVAAKVEELSRRGVLCFQKFTCINCQARLTISEPNVFYTQGHCENCGTVTDLKATGCNFLAVFPQNTWAAEVVKSLEPH